MRLNSQFRCLIASILLLAPPFGIGFGLTMMLSHRLEQKFNALAADRATVTEIDQMLSTERMKEALTSAEAKKPMSDALKEASLLGLPADTFAQVH